MFLLILFVVFFFNLCYWFLLRFINLVWKNEWGPLSYSLWGIWTYVWYFCLEFVYIFHSPVGAHWNFMKCGCLHFIFVPFSYALFSWLYPSISCKHFGYKALCVSAIDDGQGWLLHVIGAWCPSPKRVVRVQRMVSSRECHSWRRSKMLMRMWWSSSRWQ